MHRYAVGACVEHDLGRRFAITKVTLITMAAALATGTGDFDVNKIIDKLLSVRGSRPGRNVAL